MKKKKYKFKKNKILDISKNKIKFNILSKLSGLIAALFIVLIGFGFTKQVANIEFNLDGILGFAGFEFDISDLKTMKSIEKTPEGKTNILIIGKDDEGDGIAGLTDSIIIASLNYEKEHISMLSIPRDLYVEFPSGGSGKINEALYRGYSRGGNNLESGVRELQTVIENITGEEINYYISLNFNGFVEVVDILGGIEIDVPNSIVDHRYPGPNYSYQTFRINAGLQKLDGATALKYARSRQTTSDFDRSLRQQIIIKGLRDKAISLDLLASPTRIRSMFETINKNIKTNLEITQIISLGIYAKDINRENIYSSNLNSSCYEEHEICSRGGLLYPPLRSDYEGMSVLLPYGANKSNINNINNLLIFSNIVFDYPKTFDESLKINIINSTTIPGLAGNLATSLKRLGFNIPSNSVGTLRGNTYERSKIYYSNEIKPETVKALELFIFGGSENIDSIPKYSSNESDIEIVIGSDYRFFNF